MRNYFSLINCLFIVLLLSACVTNKNLEYFQSESENTEILKNQLKYKLQIGDVLSVQINTTTEQNHDFFNKEQATNSQLMMHNPYLWGYLIKEDGFLELPSIGKIEAVGLTLRELEKKIKLISVDYFDEPVVKINIINFEVQIMGEVNKPGRYEMVRPDANILDVIGKAGDLTQFANRKKVKVIRTKDDKHHIFYLDLTKNLTLVEDNFYIYPNDVIYIEPMKKRFYAFNNLPSVVSMGMSAITLYLLIQQK
tara:strand:- start:1995 stop:2750 length:756 start_codon:yes stop_codon:yes gene_type:complete